MELEFSLNIFEIYSNIKFYENPSIGEPSCSMRTCMTKLIVTFRNFAKAPRYCWYFSLPLAPLLNNHIQSHTVDIKQSRSAFGNLHRLQILTNSAKLS